MTHCGLDGEVYDGLKGAVGCRMGRSGGGGWGVTALVERRLKGEFI